MRVDRAIDLNRIRPHHVETFERLPINNDFHHRLTQKGIDLWPILVALKDWSARWGKWPEGERLNIRHKACGHVTAVRVVCSDCDEPINARDVSQEMSTAMAMERARMAKQATRRKTSARA